MKLESPEHVIWLIKTSTGPPLLLVENLYQEELSRFIQLTNESK